MGSDKSSKIALVGIDGFSPVYMKRFLEAGVLPAIEKVKNQGVSIPLISTLPATTPVAWATIATGATPAKTGIEGFLVHLPGNPLDKRVSGCYAHRCKAEAIWETASMEGKRSYVVKFPISYPSMTATLRIDGASGWGGLKCLHEVVSASLGSLHPGDQHTQIYPYRGSFSNESCRESRVLWRGQWHLPLVWYDEELLVYLLLTELESGEVVLEITEKPDRSALMAILKEGTWSEPLTLAVKARQGLAEASFRIKVLVMKANPVQLRLTNTTLHERKGHSSPPHLWNRILDAVGPIEEQTEPSLMFKAGLDLETQLEIFEQNTQWLQKVAHELLTHESWDLFMIQIHIVDWAHHLLHGCLDPAHPNFDADKAPYFEKALVRTYQMADRLVATVAEAIGEKDNLVVLGDHGQDLQHSVFRTNEWLAQEGYLVWAEEGMSIDWTKTRVCGLGNYVYLNLAGREPHGILPVETVPHLLQELVSKLGQIKDPATGESIVRIVKPKAELAYLGANGQGVGDLVFCLVSGYQAENGRGPVFSTTELLKSFTSGHDHFWPLDPRIQTQLYASGPAFKRGLVQTEPASLIDVNPTLCAVLGILPSNDCEGKVLNALLAETPVPAA